MKKLLLALGAYSLAIAPVMIPTPAAADPGKGPAADYQSFCTFWVTYVDTTESFGQCVGIFRSDDSATDAKTCLQLKVFGALDYYGFENEGDCIKALRS